jgi:hypothetical protein
MSKNIKILIPGCGNATTHLQASELKIAVTSCGYPKWAKMTVPSLGAVSG